MSFFSVATSVLKPSSPHSVTEAFRAGSLISNISFKHSRSGFMGKRNHRANWLPNAYVAFITTSNASQCSRPFFLIHSRLSPFGSSDPLTTAVLKRTLTCLHERRRFSVMRLNAPYSYVASGVFKKTEKRSGSINPSGGFFLRTGNPLRLELHILFSRNHGV